MGVFWYIINRKDKTFIELGKGFSELSEEPDALFDREYLEEFIFDDLFLGYERSGDEYEREREIAKEYAEKICLLVNDAEEGDIFITADYGEDDVIVKCLGYKCLWSRYRGEINKHLSDDRKHMYKKENMINDMNKHLFERYE